jgi:hypothetical protein
MWLVSVTLASAGPSVLALPWIVGVLVAAFAAHSRQMQLSPREERDALFAAVQENAELRRILVSPSLFVVRYFSKSLPDLIPHLRDYAALSAAQTSGIAALSPQISAFPPELNKDVGAMIDRRSKTHWSTYKGAQTGGESLLIRFPAPASLRAVELSTGAFPTDFPRGLAISTGTCSLEETPQISFSDWQGALAFTPSGFPYFSGQNDVKILLPPGPPLGCLLIKQTGSAPFDWSVTELKATVQAPNAED